MNKSFVSKDFEKCLEWLGVVLWRCLSLNFIREWELHVQSLKPFRKIAELHFSCWSISKIKTGVSEYHSYATTIKSETNNLLRWKDSSLVLPSFLTDFVPSDAVKLWKISLLLAEMCAQCNFMINYSWSWPTLIMMMKRFCPSSLMDHPRLFYSR